MSKIDEYAMEKYNKLKQNLKNLDKIVIAFSGGVDSTFLLAVVNEVMPKCFLAVIAKGPIFPERETKSAIIFLKNKNINYEVIEYNPLSNPEFKNNPPLRCYYCKKYLFNIIKQIANKRGFSHIIDGTNIDDVDDYRPGLKALKELGIISPLKDVRLNKRDIRKLSKDIYNLPTFNFPSMACLATRIPFGEKITKIKLHKIERVEKHLASLGFSNFRARHHGNLLRIEIPKNELNKILTNEISKSIIELSKNIGFTYVTIDLEGYKKGSLNESLR